MFLVPALFFFMQCAFFYLIVRWITGEESVDFRMAILWIIGAWVLGKGAQFLCGPHGLEFSETVAGLAQMVVFVGTLAVILWHQGIRPRHVWIIIGLFFTVQLGMFFLMLILRFA